MSTPQKKAPVQAKRPRKPRAKVAQDPQKKKHFETRQQKIMTKRQLKNSVQYTPTTADVTSVLAYASPTMSYDVPITEEAISALAASVVSFALSRGWQEYSIGDDYPVQAYRWISLLLASAAQNQIPISATGPYWLALIVQSLVQKRIPSRGGNVSYAAKLDLPDNYPTGLDALRNIGPLVYSRHLNFGKKTSTKVNGYFYTIDTNIPYDKTTAEAAYSSLYNFLATKADYQAMHRKVSLTDPNVMTNDASSFATPLLKSGDGDADVGGFYFQVSSEIPISSPLFSAFRKNPGANGDPGRAPNYARSKGGDGYTLSGLLAASLQPHQIHFKTSIRFKAVDFMEYLEVLALWVSKVQQKWVNDNSNSFNSPADIQCPLTLQEMALLLRSNVMTSHASSQHYAQSVFPRVPASSNSNEFVAFVSGFGTCAYNAPSMRVPRLLKENIQANTTRVNYGSRGGEAQPIFYVGVLGKYYLDELAYKDFFYTYQTGEAPVTYYSFKDPSSFDAKTKRMVSAEDPISLIDGSTATEYIAINDPAPLGKLAVLWNNWVEKIVSYTTTLATNTFDGGINALRTIGMTNHWFVQEKEVSPLTGFYAERDKKEIKLQLSPYTVKRLQATTNQTQFFKGTWEGILSKFIKPVNLITPANGYGSQTGYTSYSAAMGEFNTIVSGEGFSGAFTLGEMHEILASTMIKDKFGVPSELDIALNQLDAKGEAGILSSLAGALLGPGVGAVVDQFGLP